MPGFRPTLLTLITFMFIASIFSSVSILSYLHINVVNSFFEDRAKAAMESRVNAIEEMINREISLQKAFFSAVRNYPHIYDLLRDVSSLETRTNLSPPYPSKLRDLESYRDVLQYFGEVAKSEPSLEMLGVFWKDGNVVVGVVHGTEDEMDYRGNRGWFGNAISGNSSEEVYISAINLARHTSTPSIRYSSPMIVDGRVLGVVMASFDFRKTFSVVRDAYWGEGGYVMIVDPSYENAEGVVLGPRFIVNTFDPKTEFNESCPVCPLIDLKEFSGKDGFMKFTYGSKTEFYGYYRWTTLENGRRYLIICALTPEAFMNLTNDIKKSAVLGAISVGSVFMVASILMSRFLLGPIDDIVAKARVVASGAYDVKVGVHRGYREAEILSKAIKEMQESLLEYLRKTEEYSEGLKLVNSVIRHDTVNHLTAAMNYLEFYEETGEKEYLDRTKSSLRRVSETLRVSRVLEAVMETGERRTVSVAEIARKVGERYPEINVEVDGDCQLMADDGLFVVFDNLIQNSIKHGGAKNVRIRIKSSEQLCTIEVSDDGCGISDEFKDRIFERGFSTSGTGLGLFITKLILSRYDGEIQVEDSEPRGARFVIKIRKRGF